jgi:anaerobic magnesium-protoporphyrin IX monomethyl ester cyclase
VPALFDLIDSVVLFDGEIPLLRLAETLEAGGSLETVPNLVYRAPGSKSEIRTNPLLEPEELRAIQKEQQPDFDGLPFDRYLAPEPVLPLATSHGCYHGKCAFCNVGYGGKPGFTPLPVERILSNIRSADEKYHCRSFFFVDEAISPHTIRLLSPALRALDRPINWASAARFEKALTDELLVEAASSGCRMFLYGLESASEPIMEKMIKGTRVEEMSRILRTGAGQGIWNHTFFFFGFPGETIEHAQETVNFVYAHQDVIHSGSPGAFLLEIYSPAYCEPEKYGITRIRKDPERDLAIYFEYDLNSGLDEMTANKLADRLVDQLPEKRFGMYYISDVYKFLYASELHRRNQPLPQWIG